jgi:excisionase family DNA binding protein
MLARMDPAVRRLYFSVLDVGLMLGIGEEAVRRLIADRAIPARRIGPRVLIPRDELFAVLRDLPTAVEVGAGEDDET